MAPPHGLRALAAQSNHFVEHSISGWQTIQDYELTRNTLDALFRNEISAIRIRNFASPSECLNLSSQLRRHAKFKGYTFKKTANSILKVGPVQCEFKADQMSQYFQDARACEKIRHQVTQASFDPLKRLMSLIGNVWEEEVGLATEPGYGDYYAGVFRDIRAGALPHLDWAQRDAPGWSIQNVTAQLAWNLYIAGPPQEASCLVYNKPWHPEDEICKVPQSYHYRREVINGAQVKVNSFKPGDVVLFNSKNFHEVEVCHSSRLTMSSFMGKKPNRSVVFWS